MGGFGSRFGGKTGRSWHHVPDQVKSDDVGPAEVHTALDVGHPFLSLRSAPYDASLTTRPFLSQMLRRVGIPPSIQLLRHILRAWASAAHFTLHDLSPTRLHLNTHCQLFHRSQYVSSFSLATSPPVKRPPAPRNQPRSGRRLSVPGDPGVRRYAGLAGRGSQSGKPRMMACGNRLRPVTNRC